MAVIIFIVVLIIIIVSINSYNHKRNQELIETVTSLEAIKQKIESGDDISSEQLDFELIHKQTPTDESFLKEGLESMSKAYAYSVQTFNEEPSSKSFSSIVNNCMSCHTMLCPGPLERIDNLILDK